MSIVREDGEEFDAPHSYYVEFVGADKKLYPPKEAEDVTVNKSRAARS